mgnify:CR=1 FL=1
MIPSETSHAPVTTHARVQTAWVWYDWANSVFPLTITTAVFPVFYQEATQANGYAEIPFFGLSLANTALWSYTLSAAFLVIAFLSPLLSGIADYTGKKRAFMHAFCALGALASISLVGFDGSNPYWGLSGLFFGMIGFAGSIVFYNGFLPEIATPEQQDHLSARGFSMGYIGSVLLLILNLAIIQKPTWFGLPPDEASIPVYISFVSVGIWWYGFAQIPLRVLPDNVYQRKHSGHPWSGGFRALQSVAGELRGQPLLTGFLLAFLFQSMGVQTVMYVATLFGKKVLGLETGQLIVTVLVIQLVAIAGAYGFAALSKRLGNLKALMLAVAVWVGICVGAYGVYSASGFYVLAGVVGSVMGGVQSLSRSTYAKFLPPTQSHASYFSFFEFTEKIAIVLGTFSYGLIEDLTGSMRNSVLALLAYFVLALLLMLWLLNVQRRYGRPTAVS